MKYYLVVSLMILLTVEHCDEEKRYKVLSFFFDGVPLPPSMVKEVSAVNDSNLVAIQSEQDKRLIKREISQNEKTQYLHAPYKQKRCISCHQDQVGQELTTRLSEICMNCHEQFRELPVFVHGPVAVGQCTACHNPHSSANPFMLTRKGDAVCEYCHELINISIVTQHSSKGSKGCVDCHSPHFSDSNRFFLLNSVTK